jgi:hypothetical protein
MTTWFFKEPGLVHILPTLLKLGQVPPVEYSPSDFRRI